MREIYYHCTVGTEYLLLMEIKVSTKWDQRLVSATVTPFDLKTIWSVGSKIEYQVLNW